MSGSPFHPGELEAQARAGGGSRGSGIRDFMIDQHRAFFESLPFIAVASIDRGWPVATLLAGEPGFIQAPDPHRLDVSAELDPSDPAQRSLTAGAPAGLLGIEFASRRRNRANGVIMSASPRGFVLDVRQSFGNCPQYIQPRDFRTASAGSRPPETLQRLAGSDGDHLGWSGGARLPGAERLWRFRVHRAWRKRGVLPLRWTFRALDV